MGAKALSAEQQTAQTAIKTGKPSPINGVALPVGNHPGNTGGKKGRSGRRNLAKFLAKLREDPKAQRALLKSARDEASRNFSTSWKLAADYDTEKPAQRSEVKGELTISGIVILPATE